MTNLKIFEEGNLSIHIVADQQCWIVKTVTKSVAEKDTKTLKKGDVTEREKNRYYPTMDQAVAAAADEIVRQSSVTAEGVSLIVDALADLREEIAKFVEAAQ